MNNEKCQKKIFGRQKFKKSYSFEISAKGRKIIRSNAILNKVYPKVSIFGEATKYFYKEIPKKRFEFSSYFDRYRRG
jgi:hypothetical protein